MKSKFSLKKMYDFFKMRKSNVSADVNIDEVDKKISNSQLFNNINIETNENYFINLIPTIKERIAQRKARKRKIYYSTSFATSLSLIILFFTIFNTDINNSENNEILTDDEYNAILINENIIHNENIYSLVSEDLIEKIEDNYTNELKPESFEEIKNYNITFDIKDLDQEMLQELHDKLVNTKILGDL